VKVVDAEGKIVPVNTRGELCTRGPHVFKGYLNDDAKTKEAIRDGWYHTGDEGTISEDGRITFVGRIKEMISYKDLNVPPLEVENVLNTHPDVEEAQVIGVPDEAVVEKVCAWIKLRPHKSLTQEEITAFCKDK
ncbi:medium-chain acyl-CoA ligase ACSF2, mitochondrial, partial [Ixodes scapularis]